VDLDVDPDPHFNFDADEDPGYKNDADPSGSRSGSTTLSIGTVLSIESGPNTNPGKISF
jgi:hypothetical protein